MMQNEFQELNAELVESPQNFRNNKFNPLNMQCDVGNMKSAV